MIENDRKTSAQMNSSEMHSLCEKRLAQGLNNFQVKQMIYGIEEELGCKLPKGLFCCDSCSNTKVSGGFRAYTGEKDYKPSIVICEDNPIPFKNSFESVLVHELVHAYDFCRAKIDTADCIQHACTEIRASNLSGECSYGSELFRGRTTLQGGQMDCVKRRAELSVSMNPACKDIAKAAVEAAFVRCYADKKPLQLRSIPYVDNSAP